MALQVFAGASLRLTYLIPMLLPMALVERDHRRFILQWSPFYIVLVMYDSFRSIADNLGSRVNYDFMIQADRLLFGGPLPTVWLQDRFLDVLMGWSGTLMMVIYFAHFLLPVFTCYYLWKKNEALFTRTIASITFVSVLAFLTFLFFPAAPPWLASQKGMIPEVEHVLLRQLYMLWDHLPRLYLQMNPNPVAAFPSLHAAYPLVLWLCIKDAYPKARIFYFVNVFAVAFMLVAFGEHYVVDIIAGWAYAVVTVRCISWMLAKKNKTALHR